MQKIQLAPVITEALNHSAATACLMLDRYWRDPSVNWQGTEVNRIGRVSEEYSAYSTRASFLLPIFAADPSSCVQVGSLPFLWARDILHRGMIPIPMHPDVVSKIRRGHEDILSETTLNVEVSPTASGRTVFCQSESDNLHFIKLHYPSQLGRFMRDIRLDRWMASLQNSAEFFGLEYVFPECFGYMHEAYGTFVNCADGEGFGVLYREFEPRPHKAKKTLLAPAMSLWAKRQLADDEPPLLIQALSDSKQPLDTFIARFVRPVLTSYRFLAFENGLMPEFHEQNVIFEIDLDSSSTRLIYRDMSVIYKDFTLRDQNGMHTAFCTFKSTDRATDPDYFKHRSFMFDYRVGQSLLLPMARCLSEWADIQLDRVISIIREEVRTVVSSFPDYFYPREKWYKYAAQVGPGQRVFVELDDPLFR